MALYAFDGTWNKDNPGAARDTNVLKFARAYLPRGRVFYWEGIGTRFGLAGKVIGGITGAGGRARVRKAWKKLRESLAGGDTLIDIVGFSRGGALALQLANKISRETDDGSGAPLPIRFLGLWDVVPSFGIPNNDINIGWHLGLPDNVEKCFHAMALDERRPAFGLSRLSARVGAADEPGRLFEVWFRGVHSDVGGGDGNTGLSSIALHWMFRSALRFNLSLSAAAVARAERQRRPESPISEHEFDPIKNEFRAVRWTDQVHLSVSWRDDTDGLEHNNPPIGLEVVDDEGIVQPRRFVR